MNKLTISELTDLTLINYYRGKSVFHDDPYAILMNKKNLKKLFDQNRKLLNIFENTATPKIKEIRYRGVKIIISNDLKNTEIKIVI
jgi:hypothetical protein